MDAPYDRGMSTRIAFLKGHGTENDFVIVPDPENAIDLPPASVAALCDRRAGIGGDGLLHVVRSAAHPEARHLAAEAEWFMDYRNGDGSVAEMCGNGARVFARYLQRAGHVAEGDIAIATRGGVKAVHIAKTASDSGLPRVTSPSAWAGGAAARRRRHRERRRTQAGRTEREHGQPARRGLRGRPRPRRRPVHRTPVQPRLGLSGRRQRGVRGRPRPAARGAARPRAGGRQPCSRGRAPARSPWPRPAGTASTRGSPESR
ncbi:Diaminopimelate epimerase [Streptomyces hirsutus]